MPQPDPGLIDEIRLTSIHLDLDISPELFVSRCEAADYRIPVALDAIKELGLVNIITSEDLMLYWDITMTDIGKTIKILQDCNYSGDLEKYADEMLSIRGLKKNVLEDDSSLNLIKIRLGE